MDAVFDLKFPFLILIIGYADDLTVSSTDTDAIQAAINVQTACNQIVVD